jgi:thioredoxin
MPAKNTTAADFKTDVLDAQGLVLVDFWATWCQPCKMMAPILDDLADDLRGDVAVYKVDADAESDLVQEYAIASIPTILVFSRGEVVHTVVGAKPKPALLKALVEWLD